MEAATMPFATLLAALDEIRDPRRAQGKRYTLGHLLLFSVLAVCAGATSYRGMLTFMRVHRERLNAAFGVRFRRVPAVNTLRNLFLALDPADLETAFRRHARYLSAAAQPGARPVVALDGKTLRRSFDGTVKLMAHRRDQPLNGAFRGAGGQAAAISAQASKAAARAARWSAAGR
jgi:DDE_Tnp_1-associated